MTATGWVVMIVAAGGITVLLAWCIHRVVTTGDSAERMHSQPDIETSDADDT